MAQHGYYQGKKVELYNLKYTPKGSSSKYEVYVKQGSKDAEGRVKAKKITFGSSDMPVQRDRDENRKSFRARFKCDDSAAKKKETSKVKSDREKDVTLSYKDTKNYWNCKTWEKGNPISKMTESVGDKGMKEGVYYLRKLQRIEMFAKELMECIDPEGDLPSWIQDKITLSEHNLEASCNFFKTKELHTQLTGKEVEDNFFDKGYDAEGTGVDIEDNGLYDNSDDLKTLITNNKSNSDFRKTFKETLDKFEGKKYTELDKEEKESFLNELKDSWLKKLSTTDESQKMDRPTSKKIEDEGKGFTLSVKNNWVQKQGKTMDKPIMEKSKDDLLEEKMNKLNLLLEKNKPTNPSLWQKVLKVTKGEQKSLEHNGQTIEAPNDGKGFETYPSAYANSWAAKNYKKLGGKWKKD